MCQGSGKRTCCVKWCLISHKTQHFWHTHSSSQVLSALPHQLYKQCVILHILPKKEKKKKLGVVRSALSFQDLSAIPPGPTAKPAVQAQISSQLMDFSKLLFLGFFKSGSQFSLLLKKKYDWERKCGGREKS